MSNKSLCFPISNFFCAFPLHYKANKNTSFFKKICRIICCFVFEADPYPHMASVKLTYLVIIQSKFEMPLVTAESRTETVLATAGFHYGDFLIIKVLSHRAYFKKSLILHIYNYIFYWKICWLQSVQTPANPRCLGNASITKGPRLPFRRKFDLIYTID